MSIHTKKSPQQILAEKSHNIAFLTKKVTLLKVILSYFHLLRFFSRNSGANCVQVNHHSRYLPQFNSDSNPCHTFINEKCVAHHSTAVSVVKTNVGNYHDTIKYCVNFDQTANRSVDYFQHTVHHQEVDYSQHAAHHRGVDYYHHKQHGRSNAYYESWPE